MSHVARGHQLHAPSLRAAYARLVASNRHGAAVREWKRAHPPKEKEKDPTKGPLRSLDQLQRLQKYAAAHPEEDFEDVRYDGSADYSPYEGR